MDKAVTLGQLQNALEELLELLRAEFQGGEGCDGALWRPTVNTAGLISWEKSTETALPPSVCILGPRGESGSSPIRGTDYWTAEDQRHMVDDVLAALPVWTGGSF